MAQAILVTLEKEILEVAAYRKSGTGKALARELQRVDFAARKVKVTQPSSLLSEHPAALIEEMKAQGFDPAQTGVQPEQWFPAAEGLAVLGALMRHVTA